MPKLNRILSCLLATTRLKLYYLFNFENIEGCSGHAIKLIVFCTHKKVHSNVTRLDATEMDH